MNMHALVHPDKVKNIQSGLDKVRNKGNNLVKDMKERASLEHIGAQKIVPPHESDSKNQNKPDKP